MAKETLAVYDPDQFYLERLLGRLRSSDGLSMEVAGFTDIDILWDCLRNNYVKALLISQPETKALEEDVKNVLKAVVADRNLVVMLLGDPESSLELAAAINEGAEIKCIDKYQSVNNIAEEVKGYVKRTGSFAPRDNGKDYKLCLMYSPIDKVTHPEMAASLFRSLKEESTSELRGMYINLESFSGMRRIMDRVGEGSVSDAIYYYKTNPARLPELLRRARGSYAGMEVLLAAACLDDIKELSPESWPDFLAQVARCCSVNIMLLDISYFDLKIVCELIKYGNLYIPALPYKRDETVRSSLDLRSLKEEEVLKRAEYKMQEFRKFLMDSNHSEILDRIMEFEA